MFQPLLLISVLKEILYPNNLAKRQEDIEPISQLFSKMTPTAPS